MKELLKGKYQNLRERIWTVYAKNPTVPEELQEDILSVFDNEDEYPKLFGDPSFRESFGYIRGAADALDMTVRGMFDAFLTEEDLRP